MTDADFSSAATPDGAGPSPPAPVDGGAAGTYSPQSDSDGNQFSGSAKTVDMHPARDARDDSEQPVDIDQPREWQTPEARAEVESLVKQLQKQQQAPPQPKPDRPQDFPRSWATNSEAVEIWNTLPEHARAQIVRREQQRDTEVTRAQTEFAAKQRDIETAVAHAETAAWASWLEIAPQLEALGVKSQQDWQRLVQERPQDAQAIAAEMDRRQARVDEFQKLRAEAAQQQQQAHQQQIEQFFTNHSQAFEQYKQDQDKAAERLIPELSDPQKRGKISEAVFDYASAHGVSNAEMAKIYDTDPAARSAFGQLTLKLASERWAQIQAAKNARPKQAPRPLMPGTNNGPGRASGDAALAAAANNGDMSTYFRLRGNSGARR
jgi:hypothetical protein